MSNEGRLALRFRVTVEGYGPQDLVVDSERLTIGSGSHCEVRLPAEVCAFEHVEVLLNERTIHLRALATKPSVLLESSPIREGVWPPGATLSIGTARIVVELVKVADAPRRRSPLVLLVSVPIFALVGALSLFEGRAQSLPPVPPAPALFDVTTAACPLSDAERARPLAAERLRLARAKRERGPFAPQEAIEAVPYFEVASACFDVAGEEATARGVREETAWFRKRLEEDYRVRRVRLEHAYERGDAAAVQRELVVLQPLTQHRPGPYTEWLAMIQRMAGAEVVRQERAQKGLF